MTLNCTVRVDVDDSADRAMVQTWHDIEQGHMLVELTSRFAEVALEIICPRCESEEHLTGAPLDDGRIGLTCSACEVTWERDPRPRCPKCDGDDLYHVPQVILEKSRGTQMSVQGIHVEYGCWVCDPPEVKVRGGRTHHLPDRLGGSQ